MPAKSTQPNRAARVLGRLGGKAGRGAAKRRSPEQCRAAALKGWESRRVQRNP